MEGTGVDLLVSLLYVISQAATVGTVIGVEGGIAQVHVIADHHADVGPSVQAGEQHSCQVKRACQTDAAT